jgi:hypothetical protein
MGVEVYLHELITSRTIKTSEQLHVLTAALRLGKETVWIFHLVDTRVCLGDVEK